MKVGDLVCLSAAGKKLQTQPGKSYRSRRNVIEPHHIIAEEPQKNTGSLQQIIAGNLFLLYIFFLRVSPVHSRGDAVELRACVRCSVRISAYPFTHRAPAFSFVRC